MTAMGQPAEAVEDAAVRGVLGGPAEAQQPDAFDQDGFDATAYINELFPTGTRACLRCCAQSWKACSLPDSAERRPPAQRPASRGWTRP